MADVNDGEYERMSADTSVALQQVAEQAARLAEQEVTWQSGDGQITVRATGGGTIAQVRLAGALLRRQDSVTLGAKVAEALRSAQLKARREFTEALEAAIPQQVHDTTRFVTETVTPPASFG
jgi:DNA-binding protein YbaB